MNPFEKRLFQEDELKDYYTFWSSTLADFKGMFQFRQSRTTGEKKIDFAELTSFASSDVDKKLKALTKSNELAQLTVCYAVFSLIMSRYTQEDSIIIDAPLYHVQDAESKQTGIVPVVLPICHTDSLLEHIRKTKEQVKQTFSYQNFPLGAIDASLDLQQFANILVGFNDLTDELKRNYEIVVQIFTESDCIGLRITYCTQYFDQTFVSTISQHFFNVLNYLDRLDTALERISLLRFAERSERLKNCSGERLENELFTLPELLEKSVIRTPHAAALTFGEHTITYKKLDRLADTLAHLLIEDYAIGEEEIIGVQLDRSLDLIISIIGILKAGGTYLPINTRFPLERQKAIVNDSALRLVITENGKNLGAPYLTCINFDGQTLNDLSSPSKPPLRRLRPNNLAYIIYTSGTTGVPKGVAVQHAGVTNMILEQVRHLHIQCQDNVLQFAPISFDASIYEIWIALSVGATISMTSQENLTNMAFLTDFIERRNITTLVLPPSFLKLFDKAVLPSVTNIISAGEAVSFSDANFYRNFKKFTNAYGPTEASVCATLCNDSKYFYTDPIPIGRPIANMKVYVLDQNMQVQPVGVPGEIYISGVGIARGYLNQPERTADSFVKNPYDESSLMYKTGDMGVWLPNGQLDFQGRVDEQIKLNGFRIELSEIVYVLKQHTIVEDVVVYFIAEQIFAFIILAKTFDTSNEDDLSSRLRDFLSARLPANSVPSTIVFVNEYPLTFNGKIDKQQLVARATAKKRLLQQDARTLREEEIKMSELWKEILRIETIQPDDNFFQIGGNSLRGIQLVSQVAKTMAIEMDLVDVFNYPTIRSLTSFLDKQASFENDSFHAVEETDHYPLSYSQQSLWLTYKMNQCATNYNITVSFIIEGQVDRKALGLAYENLLKRHEILRTVFIEVQGEPRQKILEAVQSGLVILEENDLLSPSAVKPYVEAFMNEAFTLDSAPPIKSNLVVFQQGKSLFNLSLHHIIADGESTKIIINELADLYMHRPDHIPADSHVEVSYKDFAVWERNTIGLGGHPSSKQYWMDVLTPAPRHKSLLTDFVRSQDYRFEGKTVSYLIPENIAEGILNLAEKAETTSFTVLLTLIHILLRKETHEADVLTAIPFSNRLHPKLKNQIGYLANTLLVRSSLDINDSPYACVDTLKTKLLQTFKHASYPFELVVENSDVSREIGRNALFDVFVSYNEEVTSDEEETQHTDFKVVPFDIDSNVSAFDIAFNFTCTSRNIKLDIQYNNRLFLEDSIHIIYLKFLAVCNPANFDAKLSELDLDLDTINDNVKDVEAQLNLVIKNNS